MEALTIQSPQIENPDNFNIQLMDHQKAVIHAMLEWEKNPSFPLSLENFHTCYDDPDINVKNSLGILADSVGAGKTHAIVSLSLYNCPQITYEFKIKNVFNSSNINRFRCVERTQTQYHNTTLVLIPHGLFHMWKTVCETADSSLKSYCISTKKMLKNFDPLNNYNIVVVTNTFWRDFNLEHGHIQWGRWVVDEIDSIRIPNNPIVKANFTWFITATPYKLGLFWRGYKRWNHPIRNIGHINKILQKLFGMLSWYKDSPWEWISKMCIRCSPEFIEKSIKLPNIIYQTLVCDQPLSIADINNHNIVPKAVMNHLNGGDIQGAIQRLNGTTSNNLLEAVTDHLQIIVDRREKHHTNLIAKDAKDITIQKSLESVANAKKMLETTTNRFKNLEKDNCPICLDKITQQTAVKCCGRTFCFECIVKSLGTKCICPMCRSKINLNEDLIVYKDLQDEPEVEEKPKNTKSMQLRKLLKEGSEKKTLIFSEYNNTFQTVIQILDEMKINYGILKGNGNVVKSVCQKFQNKQLPVLMLNATFQGSGHNLQAADRIILYHELPSQIKEQVIGRAQRLGRTTSLEVIQLRYDSESLD